MAPLSPEFSKELLNAIDGMQAFPTSVKNILRLTGAAHCAPRELVEVIQNDPIVTIKVLRVVNSAYYSLPKQITSIDRAVVFLGFNTIKNLALSIAALSLLPRNPQAAFDTKSYLHHSLTTACIARALGARFAAVELHDYFIAGLLHDFGKVVLAEVMPGPFKQAIAHSQEQHVSLHQALLAVAGINHANVGAMLLANWRFPTPLVQAIRGQYRVDERASAVSLCVHVANQICKQIGADFGSTAPAQELSPAMQQAMGGTLDDIMESLGDMHVVMEEGSQFANL